MATTYAVKDDRLSFDNKGDQVIFYGGANQFINVGSFLPSLQLGSVGSYSTIIPDSLALDRKSFFDVEATFSMSCTTGANQATHVIQFGALGLTSNVLYKMITSITLQISNNSQTWANVNQSIDSLLAFKRDFYTDWSQFSGSAVLQDNALNFHDFYNSNKNVLGGYWETPTAGANVEPRSVGITITSNPLVATVVPPATATATVTGTLKIKCPFIMAPFTSSIEDHKALTRVGRVQIQLTTISDATQLFNVDPYYTTINSATVVFTRFNWVYKTLTIDSSSVPLQEYSAWRTDYNAQALPTIPTGVSQVSINQLSFPTQPSEICIFVRRQLQNKGSGEPTFYCPISGGNINYIENSVFTVGASNETLMYDISLRNGLHCDFQQYNSTDVANGLYMVGPVTQTAYLGGAVTVLSPIYDLRAGKSIRDGAGLPSGLSSGLTFSGTIYIKNVTGAPLSNMELVVLTYVPQVFKEVSIGNFLQSDYSIDGSVEEIHSPIMKRDLLAASDLSGAGIKSFFKKIGKFLKKKVLPVAQETLGDIALAKVQKYQESALEKLGDSPAAEKIREKVGEILNPRLKKLITGKGLSIDEVDELKGCGIDEDHILLAHPILSKVRDGKMPTETEVIRLKKQGYTEDQILNAIDIYGGGIIGASEIEEHANKSLRDRLIATI